MKLNNKRNEINTILNKVKRPITYTGNEVNAVHKKLTDDTVRFALAFPDLYEVGMSHIGLKILYSLLNNQKNVCCERVFAPWTDMEEQMVENGIPLFALESMDPIKNFDFLGFSLQYEMSYTNLLNMLNLAHINLESKDRDENDPIIIAGGPCTVNPEPLADFIDLFIIGEAEEVLVELMDLYKSCKSKGINKEGFLMQAAGLEGVYVPRFYSVEYNGNGTIKGFYPNIPQASPVIKKRIVSNLDKAFYPKDIVVSYIQTVHDRLSYEIFRGCPHGCRFCQAGQIYKPVREKSFNRILSDIDNLLKSTGYDDVALSSLSSGDYSRIEELVSTLVNKYEDKKIGVNLPSLRINALSIKMLHEMQKVRKGGITLAPEAGTQRLRDVINKNVSEEELMETVRLAFKEGWGKIKLYFMMGLPTETDDDIKGIVQVAENVVEEYFKIPKEERNRSVKVTASCSSFVPKPFTAFQWVGQVSRDELKRRQNVLKNSVKSKKVKLTWSDSELAFLEGVISRGDRRVGKVIKRAWELGCRFDGWTEEFEPKKWEQAFIDSNINPEFYASRQRDYSEILPWDFIDIGVSKDYLIMESEKAKLAKTSGNCKETCQNCGLFEHLGIQNLNYSLCRNKEIEIDKSQTKI